MSLTERSRHKLYETFSDLIDDEQAVEELLSYFPARDVEEPVTKDHLRAEIGDLRTEMHTEIGAVRVEIGALRAEMLQTARTTQTWVVSTGISLAGLMLALTRFG